VSAAFVLLNTAASSKFNNVEFMTQMPAAFSRAGTGLDLNRK
jgi:hypothetical protein